MCTVQEHGGKGPLLAHSGCVAAATAVLAALREDGTLFGILHELRVIAGHSKGTTPSHTPRPSNNGAAEPSPSGQVQSRPCWHPRLPRFPLTDYGTSIPLAVGSTGNNGSRCPVAMQEAIARRHELPDAAQEQAAGGSFTAAARSRRASWTTASPGMQTLERSASAAAGEDEFRDVAPLALQSALSRKCATATLAGCRLRQLHAALPERRMHCP